MAGTGKIFLTGHRGQLGSDLLTILSEKYEVAGFDLPELDICNEQAVLDAMRIVRPDVAIHTAAYTDVDGCESNRETAMTVNAVGTHNLALACAEMGTRLIYYSTDYVFDGTKAEAYLETDQPNPKTTYGLSKLAGERAIEVLVENHLIMRIAWVYGRTGRNFVKTMIHLGRQQLDRIGRGDNVTPLKVVDDQFGNPTWTVDIAQQTMALLDSDLRGVVHATSEGETSWYGFASGIFHLMDMPVSLMPCTTEDFPRPAPRPKRSSLENSRLKAAGKNLMRDHRDALEQFIKTEGLEL
ncbi:MAG: dTDP-4-dehydrorhamnose reductase [candidate division Zixibacteria bacterium]|nr:dTDP-4-dehydrorhamnose reductase [candidate division Zixibacteria bacterium]